MEAAAALHVHAVDPELGVALPREALAGGLRARWGEHWVRLYDVLPGHRRIDPRGLVGRRAARMGRRRPRGSGWRCGASPPEGGSPDGLGHPARARHARDAELRRRRRARARGARCSSVRGARSRRSGRRSARRSSTPTSPSTTRSSTTTGGSPASSTSATWLLGAGHRPRLGAGLAVRRAAGRRAVPRRPAGLDGYQRVMLLEAARAAPARRVLAARTAVTIAISSWRGRAGAGGARFAERYNAVVAADASRRSSTSAGTRSRAARRRRAAPVADPSLVARRRARRSGRRSTRCSTRRRSEMARADGVWITDTTAGGSWTRTTTSRASGTATRGSRRRSPARARRINTNTALPAPERDRARRAADRRPARRPRHGAVRELGHRGERPRVADGDDGHGPARRDVHRVRLPRHLGGDRGAVPREAGRTSPRTEHVAAPGRGDLDPAGRVRGRARDRPGRRDPRRAADERRLSPTSTRRAAGVACGGRARRAGCGSPTRSRPATAAPARRCGLRALRPRPGLRHARQADGQRAPGRARSSRAVTSSPSFAGGPCSSARSAATR